MAWYNDLNPFDLDDGHVWDYVPIAAGIRDIAQGKGASWETVGDFTPLAPAIAGGQDLWKGAKWLGGKVKDAYTAPYEQKAAGYDAIRAEVDRLKGVRQGQKDFAYNLADSKFAPARKALDAVYGDPSTWKL